jgi:hypothetical protein
MHTVTITARPRGDARDPIMIRLAELHAVQTFASTRLDLAVARARDLLGAGPVATAAAIEIADLLRVAASAAWRGTVVAQELRRQVADVLRSE